MNNNSTYKGSTIFLDSSVSPSRNRSMARLASERASSNGMASSLPMEGAGVPAAPRNGMWGRVGEGVASLLAREDACSRLGDLFKAIFFNLATDAIRLKNKTIGLEFVALDTFDNFWSRCSFIA